MKRRKDVTEILLNIKNEIPGFNKEELLEYTKWAIPILYNSLKNKQEIELNCKEELINKLNNENLKYRIIKSIDLINVQYVELFDTVKKDNEMYIKVYASVYFYDDVQNNISNNFENDKYWNDIWIVTYKENIGAEKRKSNCVNCGAIMEYDQSKDMFLCKYCGNIVHNKSNSKWEIVDIELEKDE